MPESLRVLEVFAGCGGLALGLHRHGWRHVGFAEIDQHARRVLQRHWPGVPVFGDVRELAGTARQASLFAPALPEFDVLAGGPPCQPASVAGTRNGADDDRWLWGEFLDLVEQHRPQVVLVENVAGLVTLNGGHKFGLILRRLASLGYATEWQHIPAGSLGAPHIRDRVFLLATPAPGDGDEPNPRRWPRAGRWDGRLHVLDEPFPKAKRGAWPWLQGGESVGRMWPTPNAGLHNYDEDPEQFMARRDRTAQAERPTRAGVPLGVAARMWPTPAASDEHRVRKHGGGRRAGDSLKTAAGGFDGDTPLRLAPEFAEWLMGWPQEWTLPSGPSLVDAPSLPWTNPEPSQVPRLVEHDKLRRPRLRCTGNGVVPLAVLRLLEQFGL